MLTNDTLEDVKRFLGCLLVAAWGCGSETPIEPSPASTDPVDPTTSDPIHVGPAFEVGHGATHGFQHTPSGPAATTADHEATLDDGWLELAGKFPDGTSSSMPFGVRTTEVAIGRTPLLVDGTARPHVIGNRGELILGGAGFTERFYDNSTGVQQTWRFDSRPLATGELVVRVATRGHAFVDAVPNGLHFANSSDVGAHYSHALWVDAAGMQYDVSARFEGERIVLRVPAEIVAASQFPAVLDPQIEIEKSVDGPLADSPTGSPSTVPSIAAATAGVQFLAVWRDGRNSNESDIYAARMTATGALTDTLGLPITRAAGVQANPVTAFVNNRYLVVWEDFKSPAADPDLVAATVSTTGVVTQLGTISGTTAAEQRPRIVVRGGQALVVFESDGDVRGVIFNGTGFGTPFGIATTAAVEAEPAGAADPAGNYLVTFTDKTATSLRGQLIGTTGAVVGAAFEISAGGGEQELSSAAFAGGNFVVAWHNNNAGRRLFGARVTTAGAVLDTHLEGTATVGGIQVITGAAVIAPGFEPALTCAAAQCVLGWQDRRTFATTAADVYAQRLTTALVPTGAEIAVSTATGEQRTPKVVLGSTSFFFVWQDGRDNAPDQVFGGRVSTAGSLLDSAGIAIVKGHNQESAPAISRAATSWFLAWADSRNPSLDIIGGRVDNSGNATGNVVTITNFPNAQITPAIATSGSQHLVTWSDQRGADPDIYAARVSDAGVVQDLSGLQLTSGNRDQLRPAVAASGLGEYLVVWQDRRDGPFHIYGAIVTTGGVVARTDIPIATAADAQVPAVAYDPTKQVFVVVWNDARGGTTARDIYGARVARTGDVLDPVGVAISSAPGSQLTSTITYGSDRFLVAWDDTRDAATSGSDIYASRVQVTSSGLVVQDPNGIAISTAAGAQAKPSAVYLGTGLRAFAIAWVDARDPGRANDLRGSSIAESSGVVGAEFAIAATSGDEKGVVLSRGNSGTSNGQVTATLLVTYQRFVPSLSTNRVFTRRITFGSVVSSCTNNCNCNQSNICDLTCAPGTDCVATCNQSSSCNIGCEDTLSCTTTCVKSATCSTDCRGADVCTPTCNKDSRCEVDCADPSTGSCQVQCVNNAQCILRCVPGSDPDCGFSTCQGGVTACGNGVFVCGIACPP